MILFITAVSSIYELYFTTIRIENKKVHSMIKYESIPLTLKIIYSSEKREKKVNIKNNRIQSKWKYKMSNKCSKFKFIVK